jgi:hypothetical protein
MVWLLGVRNGMEHTLQLLCGILSSTAMLSGIALFAKGAAQGRPVNRPQVYQPVAMALRAAKGELLATGRLPIDRT